MKLSILVSARKDSKYLAKFLMGYLTNTQTINIEKHDVRIMKNAGDTWNVELESHLSIEYPNITFQREQLGLGRHGLHQYFNMLAEKSFSDWIIYFCDDHFIRPSWAKAQGGRPWDLQLSDITENLNPCEPWCIVPKFDNAGAMNHILSRGYVEALGGSIAKHGNLDSYINDVNKQLPNNRIILVDKEWFHDFTHDHPNPMDERTQLTSLRHDIDQFIKETNADYAKNVEKDAHKLKEAIHELSR